MSTENKKTSQPNKKAKKEKKKDAKDVKVERAIGLSDEDYKEAFAALQCGEKYSIFDRNGKEDEIRLNSEGVMYEVSSGRKIMNINQTMASGDVESIPVTNWAKLNLAYGSPVANRDGIATFHDKTGKRFVLLHVTTDRVFMDFPCMGVQV